MSRSRAGSWPSTQPPAAAMVAGRAAVGAPGSSGTSKNSTTTGPATPAGPEWMWAKIGGAMPVQARAKQIRSRPVRTRARPRPSGSPGPGTSLGPVELAADGPGREVGRVDVDVPAARLGGDPPGQGGVDIDAAGDRGQGLGQ